MSYEIDKSLWKICNICGKSCEEIRKINGKKNDYYSRTFLLHLRKDHSIEYEEYFKKYCNLEIPNCPCGKCGKKLYITFDGAKIRWSKFACGRNPGQQEWSEKAKITRCGKNNPMYGKDTWNKGLTKETNVIVKKVAESRIGTHPNEETRKKQSESAKKRLIPGHCIPHSEETKEKCRQKTLENIQKGLFKQNKTKPFLTFKKILEELNINFEEEKIIHYWSFDFYLINYNIYIEVDGDYWHSNPKIYPNGPNTKTQKINWSRDQRKNKYCQENNMKLLRFWECDILNDPEKIKCKMKELLLLEK